MSLQNISKSAVRIGKNYIKGYTDTQIKVREATSNDPWGPSGAQLNELSQLSHNPTDFIEMMEILDKRLNDKGKNWRHVFKALSVLDYLLTSGSENVWNYFHDNIYIVKTLKEFQYVDDANIDQGINVRQKAKDITAPARRLAHATSSPNAHGGRDAFPRGWRLHRRCGSPKKAA